MAPGHGAALQSRWGMIIIRSKAEQRSDTIARKWRMAHGRAGVDTRASARGPGAPSCSSDVFQMNIRT